MDYTVLYLLGIIVIAALFVALARYLKKQKLITEEDLQFALTALGISSEIASQLKLKDEKQIKTVTQVVLDTVKFVKESMKDISNEKVMEYAVGLCESTGIEVTPERYMIIQELLDLYLAKTAEPIQDNTEVITETVDTPVETVEQVVNPEIVTIQNDIVKESAPVETVSTAEDENPVDVKNLVTEEVAQEPVVKKTATRKKRTSTTTKSKKTTTDISAPVEQPVVANAPVANGEVNVVAETNSEAK